MTMAARPRPCDPHQLGSREAEHEGPAPKRIVTGYGFWIFLLSDMVMFSCFFAAYAVLLGQTAGGPSGAQLFNLRNVAIETGCLLLSSFTCGMASIAAEVRNHLWFQVAMAVTCVLGLAFLCDRIPRIRRSRRARRRARRAARSCRRSSRWSAATACMSPAGMLWLLTMMAQVFAKGFRADIQRRFLCFALFWHALDIIWVAVFSVVYLLGSAA